MTSRWKLFLGVGALSAIVLAVVAARLFSNDALEKYKRELRARGEKLDLSDFRPTRNSGADKGSSDWLNAAQRLDTSPLIPPGQLTAMRFAGSAQAQITWAQPVIRILDVRKTNEFPWSDLSNQMAKAEPVLSALRAGLAMAPPDLGWDYQNPLSSPRAPLIPLRMASQWLDAAVLNDLNRGDLASAKENLLALTDCAAVHFREWQLVHQMIRMAIAGLGTAVTWEALQASGWSDADLAIIQDRWEKLKLFDQMTLTCEMERATGIYYFQYARKHGTQALSPSRRPKNWSDYLDEFVLEPVWKHGFSERDELLFVETMQEVVEATRLGNRDHSWQKMQSVLQNAMARARAAGASARTVKFRFTPAIVLNWDKALRTTAKMETMRAMVICAIAIKRHELARSRLPATLSDLVPQFLSAVPRDFMDGNKVRYRLAGDSYILYSVGEDGVDNGGDASRPRGKPGQDIWSGLDAVWPKPENGTIRRPSH